MENASELATVTPAPAVDKLGGGRVWRIGHQGLLTPGVRLLRSVSFGMKAAMLAVAFLVPMLYLGWGFHRMSGQMETTTAAEQAGVAYLRPTFTLMQSLMAERRGLFLGYIGRSPGTSAADMHRQIEDSASALMAAHAVLGGRLGVEPQLEVLKSKLAAIKPVTDIVPGGTERYLAAMAPRAEALDAMTDLIAAVADGSQLTLDHEMASYYAMDAAVLEMPSLLRQLSELRGRVTRAVLYPETAAKAQPGMVASRTLALSLIDDLERDFAKFRQSSIGSSATLADADVQGFVKGVRTYLALVDGMLQDPSGARPHPDAVLSQGIALLDQGWKLQSQLTESLDLLLSERAAKQQLFYWQVVGLVSVAMVITGYMLLSFYHVMSGGLAHLRTQVVRMASGDLSARPQPWGNDEVADALIALRNSMSKLADLLASVRRGVGAISHASDDVSSGNQDLADRTASTTRSIDQVLQALEAFQTQLGRNASMVDQVVEHSRGMMVHAVRSRDSMGSLSERMKSLNSKSREIGEIVGLIEGIAFQTHILALNASVEAARAGEAGKGFAVVAQEVRDLAKRSANSAAQISDLISNSITDIENGSELADRAGDAVRSTVDTVGEVNSLMKALSQVTRDGRQSARDMTEAIENVSSATRDNIGLVNGLSKATTALRDQGQQLQDQVGSFKLS